MALAVLLACNGGKPPGGSGTGPARPEPKSPPGPVATDTVSERPSLPNSRPAPGDTATGPAPVTTADCERLLDHFLALAHGEHAAKVAPELVPTPEQVAKIRAKLAPQFVPTCLKLERSAYNCEMSAETREQILACSGGSR